MKILIVSDTHGRLENLERVIEMTKPIDALIHLGDVEGQEDYIRRLVPCAAYMVSGNNDFFSMLPRELEFELGKYKVLINTEELRRQARSRGKDIVMFGHTHKPYLDTEDGITILNPGSLSYPRQEGRRPSYMIMSIDEAGEARYEICYL